MRKISIIIPWHNRPDFLHSLQKNFPLFHSKNVELIVVNCGGNNDQLLQIIKNVPIRNNSIVHLEEDVFNKSMAINIGVSFSNYDTLFILDCDIVLNDTIPYLAEGVSKNTFVTIEKTSESNAVKTSGIDGDIKEIAYSTSFKDGQGNEIAIETKRIFLPDNSRSCPGLILLSKSDFLKVDGMNSELVGWGWEDIDLIYRLQYAGLKRNMLGTCVHLSHSDSKRFVIKDNKSVNEHHNFNLSLSNYLVGNFMGTYSRDVELRKQDARQKIITGQ